MQSAEQFMREYFRVRSAEIEKELASRAPFREKYFTKDCLWDSRKGVLQQSDSEEIISVSSSDSEAQIITDGGPPAA